MGDSYLEVMVKRGQTGKGKALCLVTIFFAIFCAVLALMTVNLIALFGAVAFGLAAHFIRLYSDLEFEYLYVDKELTIDKIMARTKRKNIMKIHMDQLAMLAPIRSYHLEELSRNGFDKTLDFSSGAEDADIYRLVYDGKKSILIEPGEKLVRMIKNIAPRKVFTD